MSHVRFRSIAVVVCVWLTAAAAAAQPATTPRVAPRMPRPEEKGQPVPQGFSVVLVLGDNQLSAMGDNVPAAARKALADIKDFLPYRGYRLLDAQWILGSQHSTSRLRGPEDQEYQLTLRSVSQGGRVHVTFQLQEPGATILALRQADEKALRPGAELAPIHTRGVIETSFAMDIGETVVVGTSRIRGGDKALIALLTAVPKASR